MYSKVEIKKGGDIMTYYPIKKALIWMLINIAVVTLIISINYIRGGVEAVLIMNQSYDIITTAFGILLFVVTFGELPWVTLKELSFSFFVSFYLLTFGTTAAVSGPLAFFISGGVLTFFISGAIKIDEIRASLFVIAILSIVIGIFCNTVGLSIDPPIHLDEEIPAEERYADNPHVTWDIKIFRQAGDYPIVNSSYLHFHVKGTLEDAKQWYKDNIDRIRREEEAKKMSRDWWLTLSEPEYSITSVPTDIAARNGDTYWSVHKN